jgi:hypothetical protein
MILAIWLEFLHGAFQLAESRHRFWEPDNEKGKTDKSLHSQNET